MITAADVRAAFRTLGLSGLPVCVHSSLRSIGQRIECGAEAIIDAALAEGLTLVVPTFTYECEVAPPIYEWLERNGMRPDDLDLERCKEAFGYSTNMKHVSPDMGSLPAAVAQRPGRVRGDHPLNSFTAVGPLAHQIISGQTPEDVYAPLRAFSTADGQVLLMGVGLTRMTLIHLAEIRAGRKLFRRWALRASGEVVRAHVGGCSEGFEALESALKPAERKHLVGKSDWRAYPVNEALSLAAESMRADPQMTHCENPDCIRCRDQIAGGPLVAQRASDPD